MTDLSDCKLKLDRGQDHLTTLNDSIHRLRQKKMHAFRVESDPNTGKHIIYAKRISPIPTDWGLIVGEFAHNTRSALDMLVFQLSTLEDTDRARKRLQFPIFDWRHDYLNHVETYLKGVGVPDRAIIESFQPYKGGSAVCDDALGLLANINNLDKHRFIPIVTAVSKTDHARFTGPPSGVGRFGSNIVIGKGAVMKLEHGASFSSDALSLKFLGDGVVSENETPIAEIATSPETNMGMELKITSHIQFGITGHRIDRRPIVGTLTFILDRVKEVFGKFK